MCRLLAGLRNTIVSGLFLLIAITSVIFYLFNYHYVIDNKSSLWPSNKQLRAIWKWKEQRLLKHSKEAFMMELKSPSPPEIYPTPLRPRRGMPEDIFGSKSLLRSLLHY